MAYFYEMALLKSNETVSRKWLVCSVLILAVALGLTACGGKDKKGGQSLARVDGEDITMLQLNEELQRANVQASQQEAASKQLLESLIDRQLILSEAMRNKMDRTPDVMQAIERARSQIIAQAYLQGITSKIAKPSKAEIDDYFQKHPEYFTKRKQFDMRSLTIASKDLSDELNHTMDSAKSLDEVAAWLAKHDIQYTQGQGSRSSADLPPEMAANLLSMPKGRLFIVNEGGRSMLISLVNIKDSPVAEKDAAPQIEQYLFNKKSKEAVETELAHLRSLAKIEYLNASAPAAKTATTSEAKPTDVAAGASVK